jgi:DNA polymerase III alpha subunit
LCYEVVNGKVHIPLWQVKGLSERFLRRWERALENRGFTGWADFISRTQVDPADAELLARVGALRAFFKNRHEAIWRAGQVKRGRGKQGSRESDLFETADRIAGERFSAMDSDSMAEQESELLGYPVSVDPLELWMQPGERHNTIPLCDLSKYVGREMRIAGIQVSHRLHRTTKGEMMKFVTIADETGMVETVLFPDVYKKYGWELSQKRSASVRVYVEWDETESGLSLTVTEAQSCH